MKTDRWSIGGWIHAVACSLFCGAFVLFAVPRIWTGLNIGKFGPAKPNYSTDRDIEGLSGIANGSERIRQTLAALPSAKKLVIILPDHDAPSAYFTSMVTYLCWPREVEAIQVNSAEAAHRVAQLNPETFAAILFCRVPPPSFVPRGIQWASELIFVPSPIAQKRDSP